MRILVTGGAGFIGSHLCDRLLERGDQVWCVDNLRLGRRRNIAHLAHLPAFCFVEMDVLDHQALGALFEGARFEAVFHLAANSDIAAGGGDMRLDLELNQLTTVAVLEAMRKMQASLDERQVKGKQIVIPFDGKLQKPNAGEVAERLKAAVC